MKANKSILRIPPLKYAMAMILPTIASAAFARPEASQDIDTVRVEIIDNLVVKSQAPESPELLEDLLTLRKPQNSTSGHHIAHATRLP